MNSIIRIALLAFFTGSLFFSCSKYPGSFPPNAYGSGSPGFKEIVYVATNDSNQNAIIAYVNNGDGQLRQLPGGPFYTGGKGASPEEFPKDSDHEVIISNDRKFLLAVNSGSNTIAVFNINSDGTLSPVPGSPFPSGGGFPISLAHWQQYIYVANKNSVWAQNSKPNYIALRLEGDGSLTYVPGARADVLNGYPCNVLVSRNNPFLFGAEYVNHISRYIMNSNGSLGSIRGLPFVPAADVSGLWQHPLYNILYAAFPQEGKTAVYDIIPETGELTFKTSLSSGAGASNMRTNSGGDRLYVLNPNANAVAVLNTSDAEAPAVMARLNLKNPGQTYHEHSGPFTSSECFSLGFSSDEKFLYVLSRNTQVWYPDSTNNNWLHILSVQSDGTLTEPGDPIQFPVDKNVSPRGLAVYKLN
jgi:6-phosphogluconolactonase (cycloisomerase 2 family)